MIMLLVNMFFGKAVLADPTIDKEITYSASGSVTLNPDGCYYFGCVQFVGSPAVSVWGRDYPNQDQRSGDDEMTGVLEFFLGQAETVLPFNVLPNGRILLRVAYNGSTIYSRSVNIVAYKPTDQAELEVSTDDLNATSIGSWSISDTGSVHEIDITEVIKGYDNTSIGFRFEPGDPDTGTAVTASIIVRDSVLAIVNNKKALTLRTDNENPAAIEAIFEPVDSFGASVPISSLVSKLEIDSLHWVSKVIDMPDSWLSKEIWLNVDFEKSISFDNDKGYWLNDGAPIVAYPITLPMIDLPPRQRSGAKSNFIFTFAAPEFTWSGAPTVEDRPEIGLAHDEYDYYWGLGQEGAFQTQTHIDFYDAPKQVVGAFNSSEYLHFETQLVLVNRDDWFRYDGTDIQFRWKSNTTMDLSGEALFTGQNGTSQDTFPDELIQGGVFDAEVVSVHAESDFDGDAVNDLVDNCPYEENPNQVDSDGDLVGDACDHDDDGDSLPDWFENLYDFLEKNDPQDAANDEDNDLLSNLSEFMSNTIPDDPDTDGDGIIDGEDPYPLISNFLQVDGFESGDLGGLNWQLIGDLSWGISENTAYEGDFSAASPVDLADSETSGLSIRTLVSEGEASFQLKVSSESGYDFLRFYVDDVEMGAWSGEVGWSRYSIAVNEGEHVFRWEYSKDASVSEGDDRAWIDNVILPRPPIVDSDADNIPDSSDNCPTVPNVRQTDTDGDQSGDACDTDDDGDGLSDQSEIEIHYTNPLKADTDGDGISDKDEIDAGTNPNSADRAPNRGRVWSAILPLLLDN